MRLGACAVGALGGIIRLLAEITATDPWIGLSLVTLALVLAASVGALLLSYLLWGVPPLLPTGEINRAALILFLMGLLALIYAHLFSLELMRDIFGRQVEQGKGPVLLPQT